MQNVLKNILIKKKENIKEYKKNYPLKNVIESIKNIKNFIDFKKKISSRTKEKKISIIAEIKQSSPSAGMIIKDFNYLDIANIYINNGASFLSVLTEQDFFLGKLDHIKNIKKNHNIPILCKDFFIDTYQVPLAKSFGADCILIILSAVDKFLARDLYQTAKEFDIATLLEVHTKKEAETALAFEDSLIGINNRNLDTLEISLNTTVELSKILSSHKNTLISESGINSIENMRFIIEKAGIYNFLIGESLLKSRDIAGKLREFTQINVEN